MSTLAGSLTVVLSLLWTTGSVHGFFPSNTPDYCNKYPETQRKIPPLTSQQESQVASLLQVQAIVRHGSRTPYALFSCWKDYAIEWNNCNVTELLLASPSYTSLSRPAPWLFRKLYDGSENFLGGNCLTGQLLGEGYIQEQVVGTQMFDAYMNNKQQTLNLFQTSEWELLNSSTSIYLRSDDEMRTLMSGMTLIHSFLNISDQTIVPWHTGDYDLDQIYPNDEVCPRLDTVGDKAYHDSEFTTENSSEWKMNLEDSLNHIWGEGYWDWYHALDCMMTAVCTDRPLPDGTADYPMTDKIFNDTVSQSEFEYAWQATWNNSQWSKLAMGNTAWHVRNNLQSAIDTTNPTPLKLALFSAHDTTVMPFLAAVTGSDWDQRWAGYAALITIEIYSRSAQYAAQTGSSNALFRIVYNSDVLTLQGCDSALCDVQVLLDALAFGEEFMPCTTDSDAADTSGGGSGSNGGDCVDAGGVSTAGWSLLVVFCSLIGAGLGGAVTARLLVHSDNESGGRSDAVHSRHPLKPGNSSAATLTSPSSTTAESRI